MMTFLKSSLLVLVMISSMFMLICNHFHTRQTNDNKIASFWKVPLFLSFVWGTPLTQHQKILS